MNMKLDDLKLTTDLLLTIAAAVPLVGLAVRRFLRRRRAQLRLAASEFEAFHFPAFNDAGWHRVKDKPYDTFGNGPVEIFGDGLVHLSGVPFFFSLPATSRLVIAFHHKVRSCVENLERVKMIFDGLKALDDYHAWRVAEEAKLEERRVSQVR